MDLKIGILHAYPNSDLQFEKDASGSSKENSLRYERKVRDEAGSFSINNSQSDTITLTLGGGKSQITVRTPSTIGASTIAARAYMKVNDLTSKGG